MSIAVDRLPFLFTFSLSSLYSAMHTMAYKLSTFTFGYMVMVGGNMGLLIHLHGGNSKAFDEHVFFLISSYSLVLSLNGMYALTLEFVMPIFCI